MRVVERFDAAERAGHWTHAIIYLLLLITGLTLFFQRLGSTIPGERIPHLAHIILGVAFIAAPPIIFIIGSARGLLQDFNRVLSWRDKKFREFQKMHFALTFVSLFGFAITGFIMWMKDTLPRDLVEMNTAFHDFLVIITVPVFLFHIFFTTFYPKTRKALQGMITGYVDAEWAKEFYPGWIEE
jgi:formate dehydrogenase subunit gamma